MNTNTIFIALRKWSRIPNYQKEKIIDCTMKETKVLKCDYMECDYDKY